MNPATTGATRTLVGVWLIAMTLAVLAVPVRPAAAAGGGDPGLFGAADPTYDGVYRQSLAIVALRGGGTAVPAAAGRWLREQQCGDGGFPAYLPDPDSACSDPRSQDSTAADTNSTAMAAMALKALRARGPARTARAWLARQQSRSGGFPFYPGGRPDANSTGLALAALRGAAGKHRSNIAAAQRFLSRLSLKCGEDGFLLRYRKDTEAANLLASAQGALGYAGSLPPRPSKYRPRTSSTCSGARLKRRGDLGWDLLASLRTRLRSGAGLLRDHNGDADLTATVQGATALAMAGTGRKEVRRTMRALSGQAPDYIGSGSEVRPGAAAQFLILRIAAGRSTHYAGLELSRTILGTLR